MTCARVGQHNTKRKAIFRAGLYCRVKQFGIRTKAVLQCYIVLITRRRVDRVSSRLPLSGLYLM